MKSIDWLKLTYLVTISFYFNVGLSLGVKLKTVKINVLGRDCRVESISFRVDLLLLGGWAGRDRDEVMKHVEELARIGVPRPRRVPILIPVGSYLIDVYDEVDVQSQRTNGEVEYVLFIDEGVKYVTVGSDHTDRELEKIDVGKSKQAYPKVIAPLAWRYEDVVDHWDDIVLRSIMWINGRETLYQNSQLKALITPTDLLRLVDELNISRRNLIVFSGTIPVATGELMFGERFRMEMIDPVLNRCLSYEYRVRRLPQTQY